jgi:hypothetical protein
VVCEEKNRICLATNRTGAGKNGSIHTLAGANGGEVTTLAMFSDGHLSRE